MVIRKLIDMKLVIINYKIRHYNYITVFYFALFANHNFYSKMRIVADYTE